MKILVDMNLSIRWLPVFERDGHDAKHWGEVGSSTATDSEIFAYARENQFVVFTQDLDFSAILANTQLSGPSLIQLRLIDSPATSSAIVVLAAIRSASKDLETGAILTIDQARSKVRVLPIGTS